MENGKTLTELASLVGGTVSGDVGRVMLDAAAIEDAGPDDITFVGSPKHVKSAAKSGAGAFIVGRGLEDSEELSGRDLIVVEEPLSAFAEILDLLRPKPLPPPGVDPKAGVHPGAKLGENVSIGPCAVIEEGASIGDNTIIYAGVYVGFGARIGSDCVIHPNVTLREGTEVGSRVLIHSNTAVGSDGFGYVPTDTGLKKVPQRGTVRIEDDSEIGSCVTIDRATTGVTVIGRGAKIDNLVQVAHNVTVGEGSIIVAQVGISGSTKVGSGVQIGGQAGIVGHLMIGDGARIGAGSGVLQDIPSGETYSGSPAVPHGTWLRSQTVVKKLPELKRMVEGIEKRLKGIEVSLMDEAMRDEETGDD